MLIVKVKENESIDRALKRYKKKIKQTKLLQGVRANQAYQKPSEKKKMLMSKARYRQKVMDQINHL